MYKRLISLCVLAAFCVSLAGCSTGLSSARDSRSLGMGVIIGGVAGAAAGGLAGTGDAGAALIIAGGVFGALIGSLLENQPSVKPQVVPSVGIPGGMNTGRKERSRSEGRSVSPGVVPYPPPGGGDPSGLQPGRGFGIDMQTMFRSSQPSYPQPAPADLPSEPAKGVDPKTSEPLPDKLNSGEEMRISSISPEPRIDGAAMKNEAIETPLKRDDSGPIEAAKVPPDVAEDSPGTGSSVWSFLESISNFQGFTVSSPVLEDIFFDFETAGLSPSAVDSLVRNIRILRDNPGMTVRLESFVGKFENIEFILGIDLSQRRALLIKDYLILAGIPSERLKIKSFGRTMPIVLETGIGDNRDLFAARLNRRVHFEIETFGNSSGILRILFE